MRIVAVFVGISDAKVGMLFKHMRYEYACKDECVLFYTFESMVEVLLLVLLIAVGPLLSHTYACMYLHGYTQEFVMI